jgi:type III secretion protein V
MSFTDAAATYSILTVGDGLVAQIPALLVSITAGTVVTRVTGGGSDSLGGEIAGQLGHDSRALNLAAVIAILLGLIPGFPTFVFLGLAAIFFLFARAAARRKVARDNAARPRAAVPPPPARVQIHLSAALVRDLTAPAVEGAVARAFAAVAAELGIPVPAVATQQAALPERRFRADLDGVPLAEGEIPPAVLLLRDEAANAVLAGVAVTAGRVLPGTAETLWVADAQRKTLGSAGIGYMEPADALAQSIAAIIKRQASQLIGLQETRQIYGSAEQHWGDLAREAQRLLPPQKSADLFRRLLDDGLSLRNLRGLLESILEHAPREQDPANLAEVVRAGMRRQICHLYADPLRVIGAFIIEGEAEQILRDAVTKGAAGPLDLAEGAVSALIDRVRAELSASSGPGPVVLTIADLRRPLRLLLANNGVYAPVLAFADLLPDYTVQALGQIRLTGGEKVEQIPLQPRAA